MSKSTKGHLIALLALASMMPGRVLAQDADRIGLPPAPPEQTAAYNNATAQGVEGLVDFMRQYPNSRLVPAVVRALAVEIGVGPAVQAALNAGVPIETVIILIAELSPSIQHATATIPGGSQSSGIY
jgi:hypothetical protein